MVGVNCKFGPNVTLESIQAMRTALQEAGLKPYLMCQPLGFLTPDVRDKVDGYLHLPEFYLGNIFSLTYRQQISVMICDLISSFNNLLKFPVFTDDVTCVYTKLHCVVAC